MQQPLVEEVEEDLVVVVVVVAVVLLPWWDRCPPLHSRTAAPPGGHLEQGCCSLHCCITAALPLHNLLAAWAGAWWTGLAE